MFRRTIASGQLRLESLEGRRMMAGDVSAQVLAGTLAIQGDNADDSLTLTQIDANTLEITGAHGTTVNGQASPVDLTGVTGNIGIHLGDGADQVTVTNLQAPLGLYITLGNGNDTLNVSNVSVAQIASIQLGGGNNVLNLAAAPAPTGTTLAPPSGVQAADLFLKLGGGDNTVSIGQTAVSDTAVVGVGGGKNVINIGNPGGALSHSPFDVSIGETLSVFTGNGGDVLNFNAVEADYIPIVTGAGADRVSFTKSEVEILFVSLGQGDDVLDLSGGGNDFGAFSALGGLGNDTFHEGPNNQFGRRVELGFELDN